MQSISSGIETNEIYINTGEVGIGTGDQVLNSSAIGSCVVVILADLNRMMGGMAHILLPGKAPEKSKDQQSKYACNAIDLLVDEFISKGSRSRDLIACAAGGGNVLKLPDDSLCRNNIKSVKSCLSQLGIRLIAEDTGGTLRRMLRFFCEDGRVFLSIGGSKERLLAELHSTNHT